MEKDIPCNWKSKESWSSNTHIRQNRSRINHILGHKSSLSKFKKIEIISSIFSDHNAMRLEINYKKEKTVKIHKHVKTKQYATKQPICHWRNQRGNHKIPRDKWKWKHDKLKPIGLSKSSSKKEFYNNTLLPQETRKISYQQSNLTPKETRERRTNKTQS